MATDMGVDGVAETWRSVRISPAEPGVSVEQWLLGTVWPWLTGARADGRVSCWLIERPGAEEAELHLGDATEETLKDLRRRAGEGIAVDATDAFDPASVAGPRAAALCARHLEFSSHSALSVLQDATSREKRLRSATRYLFCVAEATGSQWRAAVGWLRSFAQARAGLSEAVAARAEAEAYHLRNETEELRLRDETLSASQTPNTPPALWGQAHARVWAELLRLEEAGLLDLPARRCHQSLVEHTLRVLGLSPGDQVHAAWRASYGLVGPGPREPYFADHPGAVDRLLHEYGKFTPSRLLDQKPDLAGSSLRGRQELPAPMATITLPPPSSPADAPSLDTVLLNRRSSYGRYRGPLSLAELSSLLYFSAGQTADKQMTASEPPHPVRPYPSGGTRYPLRLLLYCHDVTGLPCGTYLYEPAGHALAQLDSRDISAEVQLMAPATDPAVPKPPKAGGNLLADACPVWLFTVADLTFQRLHYGLRSYRLVLQESGHLAQNVSLVTTWLGRHTVGIGGFYDDTVNQLLGLDGVNSAVVYVHLIGTAEPEPEPWWPGTVS